MQFGVIGSGSWATALAKILTDNRHTINWCVRHKRTLTHLSTRRHNPNYLSSVYFDNELLRLTVNVSEAIESSDCIVVAIPSAYAIETLKPVNSAMLSGKKLISAIKGILPENNLLLNEYL